MTVGVVRLADPVALAALALVLAAVFLALRRESARRGGGLLFSSVALLPAVRPSLRVRLRWLPVLLRGLALVLLVVSVARPQIANAAVTVDTEGIDIVLALDTSSSMSARDFGGVTRFEGATRAMRRFIGELKNDRVGIAIFSAEGLELAPLSLDHVATDRMIAPLVPGRLLRDGTAIGTGIATGINMVRESTAKSKVLILFTDGENNAGDISPVDASELAKLLGVRLYTVGAVGGSTPEVDEKQLADIAERTGGRYFRASNETGLVTIYQDIQRLEKSRLGRRQPAEFEDVYLLPLLVAFGLLACEALLRTTLLRRVP